jgi:hypothetical protein
MKRRQGSGRSPLLQTRDKQGILGFVQEHPSWTREQVAVVAAARGSPRVSRWTVGRYLKSINWIKCLSQTKPMLTQEQKRKRLTWCLEHRNTDWSKMVFSDEASFQLFSNKTPVWMMKKKKKTEDAKIFTENSCLGCDFLSGHFNTWNFWPQRQL